MRTASITLLCLAMVGCAPPALKLAEGATCTKSSSAGADAASLRDALARATPGTCVVATAAQYQGEFTVPAGVILGAEPGVSVALTGTQAATPTLTLGAGATLTGLRVVNAPGIGVLGAPGVQLLDVKVDGALAAGVVFWCEEDCRTAGPAALQGVELTGNAVGLVVHGSTVNVTGGKVSGSRSTAIASGYGVVVSAGAVFQMTDTAVEDNQEVGLLVDGALDTSASLLQVKLQHNQGRGLWAQGLLGSPSSTRLQLSGCVVEGNRIVGLGTRASRGVRVDGGRMSGTLLGQAMSAAGTLVSVGDGLGLFAGSGDVLVDGATLENNARSQVLIDDGALGLRVQNSTVNAGTAQGVVVQRTTQVVTAPMIFVPPAGQELPFSAPTLALPTR